MSRIEQIGDCTLYLGDCREILPTLGKVDAVVTDPPYGIGINYGAYRDDSKTYWQWFLPCVEQLRASSQLVVFTHTVKSLSKITGWDWVGVWNKPGSFASRVGNSAVLPHWEPIYLFGIHALGTDSEFASDVLTFNPQPAKAGGATFGRAKWKDVEFTEHPCPKPVALYQRILKSFGQRAGMILDPFMGSGTTGVACVNLGRKFIGIEIEPKYFDIACRRIEDAVSRPDMFIEAERQAKQEALFESESA